MSITLYKQSAFKEESFLSLLCELPKPPKQLYVEGTLPTVSPDTKVLVVVGARKYSTYGKDVCEMLIKSLAGTNTIIVSGLALGIDTIAHRAAIDAGLISVAVPGSGLGTSVLYPRTNLALAREIVECGGALLSEYDMDKKSALYMFPERNRIMAGLAHAVLIIEAEKVSGTLITARLATEYNRDVLTVPHSIFSPLGEGPHMLIRLGATPITSGADLREALRIQTSEEKQEETNYEDVGEVEKKILDILYEEQSKDNVIAACRLPAHEVLMYLTLLEMKGYIQESLGMIRRVR